MEITGKIIAALQEKSGTSASTGNSWKVQEFVLETQTDANNQYPRRCVFSVFGEDKLREFNIKAGETLTVSFDIDAREYQGRWYNSIRAWRVVRPQVGADMTGTVPPTMSPDTAFTPASPSAPASEGSDDDLPF